MNKKIKKESSKNQAVSLEVLKKYSEAFNKNNIELIMECFDKNAVFDNASGSEIFGKRFKGHKSLRAIFENLFNNVERVNWETIDERISGNKAYCEYRRRAKLKNGDVQDFNSIDILSFNNGLIVHKDTYYKNRIS